jgi:hypothetical protein
MPAPKTTTGGRQPSRTTYQPLARWLAAGALALVTILFLLIVLQ